MHDMTARETDFLVIGSGIAGLTTALSLAQHGHVMIITKAEEVACNSYRAQGGIAAAIGSEDSIELHRDDTLRTGVGHADAVSVTMLVQMAPETIQRLTDWGISFDREGNQYALTREGSHSQPRILHVTGDATGKGMIDALLLAARKHPSISFVSHMIVCDLLLVNGECIGVTAFNDGGIPVTYVANYGVVLATGGCGQVYRYTTNDLVSTGDGLAMAYRAGAVLTDMEFIQFHPTALKMEQNPMFLISEAVRGEGAKLVTSTGYPFMDRYSEWGDLAPRDIVSRAIYNEMMDGHDVFLDARSLQIPFAERFPTIFATCKQMGINPDRDLIPVTPAAHFIMGGIKTDRFGRTNIPRLYACGEVACTGVHGANRLASNSLLEAAVFAQRVAQSLATLRKHTQRPCNDGNLLPIMCNNKHEEQQMKQSIQQIMWECAGIVRSKEGMKKGLQQLSVFQQQALNFSIEIHNMLQVAQIILRSALWREESRGGHYRLDFPQTEEKWALQQYMVKETCGNECHSTASIYS
jgi:L-aspartate oxidase